MINISELKDPNLLSNEQIAKLLPVLDQLIDWAKQVQNYALDQILKGEKIEGFKVVEGRSNRKYKDELQVANALIKEGFSEALIYEKRLYGVSSLEKIIGKKKFEEVLKDLIEKPAGKPTLVREDDPRKPYDSTQSAAADFD